MGTTAAFYHNTEVHMPSSNSRLYCLDKYVRRKRKAKNRFARTPKINAEIRQVEHRQEKRRKRQRAAASKRG